MGRIERNRGEGSWEVLKKGNDTFIFSIVNFNFKKQVILNSTKLAKKTDKQMTSTSPTNPLNYWFFQERVIEDTEVYTPVKFLSFSFKFQKKMFVIFVRFLALVLLCWLRMGQKKKKKRKIRKQNFVGGSCSEVWSCITYVWNFKE